MADHLQRLVGAGLIGLSLILLFLLVLVKVQQDKEGAFLCQIVEDSPDLTMEQCPAHDEKGSWFITAAFGIALAMLAIGALLAYRTGAKPHAHEGSSRQESVRRAPVDVSKLDDDERRIVVFLQERDGSAYQSDIVKELQLTKVRTTRLLDKLEARGTLERKRRGMTNIVVLK